MTRLRLLVAIFLCVSGGLVLSLGLAGCGSSGNGPGEKVMDIRAVGFGDFKLAASDRGVIALSWVTGGGELELSELQPNAWNWSKPELVATVMKRNGFPPDDVALAYDGSGRILIAWTTNLGSDSHGRWRGIGVKERIRNADGGWQPTHLIAHYPMNAARSIGGALLDISSAKRSFALGWYEDSAGATDPFANVSGFRVLRGNKWLPPVYVGAEGSPVRVQLLDGRPPMALWTLPVEKRLMYASLRSDGKLSKAHMFGKGVDSLTTSFDSNQAVAAWYYNNDTWSSVWSGERWTKPKDLGAWNDDSSAVSPIATAISRGRAVVFWGQDWTYSLWRHRNWTKPSSLAQNDSGWNVSSGALGSGEIVLVGLGQHLHVIHLPLFGAWVTSEYPIDQGSQLQAFASSPSAVALAWEENVQQSEDHPVRHLFAWVYRP